MDAPSTSGITRRGLLGRAGTVAAGSVALAGVGMAGQAHAATNRADAATDQAPGTAAATEAAVEAATVPELGPVRITPGDIRYDSLLRGDNFRFVGQPDEVRVVTSTEDVVHAVTDAVRAGKRIAPRSGGHCFENFTADPAVQVLLDMSPMNAVGYDRAMRAFSIQPGARLGEVYTALFKGWAVTLPAGGCPDVGAGGHFTGGGYGPLSRRYGSVVDHLYAVEVVVVDKDGRVRVVTATREPDDPHHGLWWAHAGGGGGNFGVVTRFWFRSPGATGADPAKLLPPVPGEMYFFLAEWRFDASMTEDVFTKLLHNFGVWHEQHSVPGAPGTGLYAILEIGNINNGTFTLVVQADGALPDIKGQVDDLLAAITADGAPQPVVQQGGPMPWLHMTTWPGDGEGGDKLFRRYKLKAAYLKKSYTDDQLHAIYAGLSDKSAPSAAAMLLIGYGGQVQAVAPDATAVAQRDVVMKAVFSNTWLAEADDAANVKWIQEYYRSIYAATGGVPVPNDVSDGSYINYPDVDLADPAWNTSGVPWSELYYKDNYQRLQQIKAVWDPRNLFRHALSIELPA
ncbi:FAD-binding protein [Catenulispora sp. NF23]|uniref:FAD-binding protein n=1 Tax=Catenulispora pinistramenti TaxID=2705254 RepID=A0ABS5L8S2_9ACTN|nr:FAD-binding protein [Catenulispora pinistramenti]MBS2539493.1 FAD-binding protein [Catenulispora pinistramenti]MBS2554475.1 FAD-binding protein [Catenulispora pinistramenti]